MKLYKGDLFSYFETGTEGILPALQEYNTTGYEGLRIVDPNDHLTLYKDGEKVFSGKLKAVYSFDYDKSECFYKSKTIKGLMAGWKNYEKSKNGQLHIGNYWVHWLPVNVDLDLWWQAFFSPGQHKYTGELRKK